jgi:transcriptional regulator with XRE-family HTH domain
MQVIIVNTRKLALGNRNIVGARVTQIRKQKGILQKDLLAKLQVAGIDISLPALSLLEGQKRPVFDTELKALSEILDVDVRWLLGQVKTEI